MAIKWGEYGDPGTCPNCGADVFFGAEGEHWCYPIAAPSYPPKKEDYKDSKNWRCWSCHVKNSMNGAANDGKSIV